MDNNFFDFAKTKDALSELSTGLIELESVLKTKKASLENGKDLLRDELSAKEEKISELNKAAQAALETVENISKQIEEML